MIQTEVVILANSIKHGQHCVAGKISSTKAWVRPVSNENGAELSHEQAKYQNIHGVYTVKPLQIIKMGFSRHVPLTHQPENYLIDGNLWQQNYGIQKTGLSNYLDTPDNLWGVGNRVSSTLISLGSINISQSLYLVQVDQLNLSQTDDGKRRATFRYNGTDYDLAVTDPKFDQIIREELPVSSILCISLGEDFQGYCYKLVATIF